MDKTLAGISDVQWHSKKQSFTAEHIPMNVVVNGCVGQVCLAIGIRQVQAMYSGQWDLHYKTEAQKYKHGWQSR